MQWKSIHDFRCILNNWLAGDIGQGMCWSEHFWIGLSTTITGNWSWIDRSDAAYRNWAKGSGSNDGDSDQCAVLKLPEAKWLSQNCT